MNIDEIIKLARKAGGYDGFTSPPTNWDEGNFVISPEELLKFASLVRNAVLEECELNGKGVQARVAELEAENARLRDEAASALRADAEKAVAWARPVYARPVNAPGTGEWDELVDIEFYNRPEKPEGEGWRPLVVADTGDGTAPLPRINVKCETVDNGITGVAFLNVIRVEQEDDGSLTAVIDHWPRLGDGARMTEADRELRERAGQMILRLGQFALIQRRRRYPKNAELAAECAELLAALAARVTEVREIVELVTRLRDRYVANRHDSRYTFIACITPGVHGRDACRNDGGVAADWIALDDALNALAAREGGAS